MRNSEFGQLYAFCISLKDQNLPLDQALTQIEDFIEHHFRHILEQHSIPYDPFLMRVREIYTRLNNDEIPYRECAICYAQFWHLFHFDQGNVDLCELCVNHLSNGRRDFLNPITRQRSNVNEGKKIQFTWTPTHERILPSRIFRDVDQPERTLLGQFVRLLDSTRDANSISLLHNPNISPVLGNVINPLRGGRGGRGAVAARGRGGRGAVAARGRGGRGAVAARGRGGHGAVVPPIHIPAYLSGAAVGGRGAAAAVGGRGAAAVTVRGQRQFGQIIYNDNEVINNIRTYTYNRNENKWNPRAPHNLHRRKPIIQVQNRNLFECTVHLGQTQSFYTLLFSENLSNAIDELYKRYLDYISQIGHLDNAHELRADIYIVDNSNQLALCQSNQIFQTLPISRVYNIRRTDIPPQHYHPQPGNPPFFSGATSFPVLYCHTDGNIYDLRVSKPLNYNQNDPRGLSIVQPNGDIHNLFYIKIRCIQMTFRLFVAKPNLEEAIIHSFEVAGVDQTDIVEVQARGFTSAGYVRNYVVCDQVFFYV